MKPDTLTRWRKRKFREFWRWKSHSKSGRPAIPKEHISFIRKISSDHPEYGEDRIALEWTAAQILQAFPWDKSPRFLFRDRDGIYGAAFAAQVKSLDITEILTVFRSPCQTPHVERLIGSIR